MKIIPFIKSKMLKVRRKYIALDMDIALLYNIEIEVFRQTIKTNANRFTKDGMFLLTKNEWKNLNINIETLKHNSLPIDGANVYPYAFTAQGVVTLNGIFHNIRVVKINIAIIQAFTDMEKEADTN
ncbi:MAG: ORF6N domain-containing protein [Chitinophagaceae bacterium]|nr:ORF6N domain-containing protein [Chitinophagaceae bacterium]